MENFHKDLFEQINEIKNLKDDMSFELLIKCIDNYNNNLNFENQLNKLLKGKKIRKSNFPSHISENIIKFVFYKRYNILPSWNTDKGDLIIDKYKNKEKFRIECKASVDLNNSLNTFGPKEYWDYIYFLDAKDTINKNYKVYEIKLSNQNNKWKNLQVNKNQNFSDQCKEKRRPRLNFNCIKEQLKEDCKLIFDGNIKELSQFF